MVADGANAHCTREKSSLASLSVYIWTASEGNLHTCAAKDISPNLTDSILSLFFGLLVGFGVKFHFIKIFFGAKLIEGTKPVNSPSDSSRL